MYMRIIVTLAVLGVVGLFVSVRNVRSALRDTAADSPLRMPTEADARLDVRVGPMRVSGTLEQAFEQLRAAAGARMLVRWDELTTDLRDSPVDVSLPADATLGDAVQAVLDHRTRPPADIGVYFSVVDGIIVVGGSAFAGITRAYNVRDVVLTNDWPPGRAPSGPSGGTGIFIGSGGDQYDYRAEEAIDQLGGVIRETVDPDHWRENGGSVGGLREISGVLVITTTWHGHREIERLLATLRREMVTPRVPSATDGAAATTRPAVFVLPPEQGGDGNVTVEFRAYDVRPLVAAVLEGHLAQHRRAVAESAEHNEVAEYDSEYAMEKAEDEVRKFVLSNAAPGTWADDGARTGTAQILGGRLLVRQTPAAHAQVRAALDQFAATFANPPAAQAGGEK